MALKDSKRARVMGRSKKLGHCICDPRKNCPCNLLIEKDVCLCAGERLPPECARRARSGGGADEARQERRLRLENSRRGTRRILARLPAVSDPRLLVGLGTADDAGVFQVSPDSAWCRRWMSSRRAWTIRTSSARSRRRIR